VQHCCDVGPPAAQANQTDRGTQKPYPDHEPTSAQDHMVEVSFSTRNFPAFTCLAREVRLASRQKKKRICPDRGRDALHDFLIVLDLRDGSEIVSDSEHHERNTSNEQMTFVQDAY